MTDRIPLDDMTDDALDQLCAELAEARAEQDRFRTMYDASEARVNDLIEERDKLDGQLTTMTDVARSNRRHVREIVPELETATQRAERAEAAIERVRAFADLLDHLYNITASAPDRRLYRCVATDLRARLDEQQEQT
ncbi:hypothetical protein [Streptomyces sp. NPDC126499]|uniref:hypothetical protein n=1 Tax=Streptomyces sp. NPDC126499 TaxID=3155314 RepID=UPI003330C9C1